MTAEPAPVNVNVPALAVPPDPFEATVVPLWQQAQAGDEAAYRACLAHLARRVRLVLRRRMPDAPDEVEDVVQETLLAIHLQRGSYDPAFALGAWVLAIARHKCVDHWRRHGRRGALHEDIDEVDERWLVAHSPGPGTRHDLQALLAELPQAQRQAIVMTKLEGLSVQQASARSGASASAIKVQVHRGLKRLAELIKG
jgi:RNA polymerase sigma-70 factor, ECF subfamily